MRKRIILNTIVVEMFCLLVAYLIIASLFKGAGLSDQYKALLTVTSFIFGFYISNLITQSRARHTKIVESLREESGTLKTVYTILEASFPTKILEEYVKKVDNYSIAGMDYRLVDFYMTSDAFNKLFQFVINVPCTNALQTSMHTRMLMLLGDTSKFRTRIETIVKERVWRFEWLTILSLLSIIIFFIMNLNNGSIVSIILTSTLCTAISMLLLILHSLDSMRWKENQWFWKPLDELFTYFGLLPYYPKMFITSGRVNIEKGKKVRLAIYKNAYPDVSQKTIEFTE